MSKLILKSLDQQASAPTPLAQASSYSAILDALNPTQREAAAVINGPLLILAGAGSGKTRVLTYRIAYMIEKGVQPWNILALTFTNKAAGEMQERIAALVGEDKARRIWAGTFHSVFARILRREAEQIGFTSAFSIYDADDSLSVIKAIMNGLGISQQNYNPTAVRGAISSAKNKMLSWQEYQREAGSLFEKQVGMIYKDYEKRLAKNNAMDFDDLLLNMIRLLRNNAGALERYQDQFRYILIDEYQDTNKAQYEVVNLLARKYRNVCVVGDDAQSIYKWRGADIRNILDFERDYADANVVRLEQNYRSTKVILEAANDVINRNSRQIKKALWTDNAEGAKIQLLRCRDDREEAEIIARTVKTGQAKHGRSLEDYAVLYRTNAQSQAIEDALRRDNIPYLIVGGVSFYKRKEVKDTISYLRAVVNPRDDESLLRIVNEPPRGLGKTSIEHLQQFAEARNLSLLEAFQQAEQVDALQKRAQTAAHGFATILQRAASHQSAARADEVAKMLMESSGLLKMYEDDGSEEALDRWNNIQRVLSHLAEYCERRAAEGETATLEQYLQEIALIADIDVMKAGGKHVTLMTIHSSKGLEFPVVFIAGMERGLFPGTRAEQQQDEMEEERRLFYVGITRAEEQLYLTHTEKRYRFGELTYPLPSPFLGEIRAELMEHGGTSIQSRFSSGSGAGTPTQGRSYQPSSQVNTQSRGTSSQGMTYWQKPKEAAPKRDFDDIPAEENYSQASPDESFDDIPLRVGSRVRHQMFGDGKVAKLTGAGETSQVEVDFASVGRKKLVLKFAKLTVLS
jgi:DNA helicase-2/ATP-dependent DNA helicase PcrA